MARLSFYQILCLKYLIAGTIIWCTVASGVLPSSNRTSENACGKYIFSDAPPDSIFSPMRSLFYIPLSNTLVCSIPKVGCTTTRSIIRDIMEWNGKEIPSSYPNRSHDWYFAHKWNMQHLSEEVAFKLMKDRKVRKLTMLREPEDRFISGILDKGHKILNDHYVTPNCSSSSTSADGNRSNQCWMGKFPSVAVLQHEILSAVAKTKVSLTNDHFAPQYALCHMQNITYGHVLPFADYASLIKLLAGGRHYKRLYQILMDKFVYKNSTNAYEILNPTAQMSNGEVTIQPAVMPLFRSVYSIDRRMYGCYFPESKGVSDT